MPSNTGSVGRDEWGQRVVKFQLSHWAQLIQDANEFKLQPSPAPALQKKNGTMTALRKDDGGVRGIATGLAFRRLVAKYLARQSAEVVEAVCSPFQFALSTRVGRDCVGDVIRALTDANPSLTVTSKDGVGAYDHVYRSAMLSKLLEVPQLRALLPLARSALC